MEAFVVIRLPASDIVVRSVLSVWHSEPERGHPFAHPSLLV